MTDIVSITKMMPISGRTRIWPVMSAVTASVAPSDRAPESPMKICAGWTLNHRKPRSAPMMSDAQQRQVRLGERRVEQRDDHVGHEGDGDRPARQPVEPVGDVDAVGGGHDGERPERDVDPRIDRDLAHEWHRDRGDVVRLLDLPGGHEGHDGQPDELLADADPFPGLGVEVVVEGAQQADPGERGQRRERRRVGS